MATNLGTEKSSPSAAYTPSPEMSAVLAQNWWAIGLRGVFAILFALVAFVVPGATILSLVLFFSAYTLVDGLLGIIAALRAARRHERWGLLVVEGMIDILTGIAAFLWPGITVLVFVSLIAAWAIISGALMIGAALRLQRRYGRWWLALGGLASVVFGVLLIIAPLAGAVVLTWWLGAYALVFGVSLVMLAFHLRARRNESPRGAALQGA
jgi:uncharacterized membrane protein HdeD (DUF308 family)